MEHPPVQFLVVCNCLDVKLLHFYLSALAGVLLRLGDTLCQVETRIFNCS